MYFTGVTAASPYVRSGKLRALGMAGRKRSVLMPEIPTIAEQGVREFDVTGWNGLMAPAHTPNAIIRRLYQETAKILNSSETKNFILSTGAEPSSMEPEQFGAYLRAELVKWGKVVKMAGSFKPE
jgi:tripartite-type tricarboxylate transporter receptor subunit TctC